MNIKRFIIAVVAVYVAFFASDYIIHGLILGKTYMAMEGVWRKDMMSLMWIFHITRLVLSLLFVYIFTKGYEGKGILEGLRYGIVMGLLMNTMGSFTGYALYPLPFSLVIQWFIYGMILYMIVGIITAAIYRPKGG